MVNGEEFPKRVRVLILGGGIHGSGVAHDLATRGWRDVHLLDRMDFDQIPESHWPVLLGEKFIQSQNFRGIGLLSAELAEQDFLCQRAPDIVTTREFVLPLTGSTVAERFMIKSRLVLASMMSNHSNLCAYRKIASAGSGDILPTQTHKGVGTNYAVTQVVTQYAALVQRVANSARMLGVTTSTGAEVLQLESTTDGWNISVRTPSNKICKISALYVVNCLGPWANALLERSGLLPTHQGICTRVTTLSVRGVDYAQSVFMPAICDRRRPLFLMPWQNKLIFGSHESHYVGDFDTSHHSDEDVDALIQAHNHCFEDKMSRDNVVQIGTSFKWSSFTSTDNRTETNATQLIGERSSGRGLLFTVYNNDMIKYRKVAQSIGDRISSHFGEFTVSGTELKANWFPTSVALGSTGDLNSLERPSPYV